MDGSIIEFSVDSVKNPLSFAPIQVGIRTTFQGGNGIIDNGTATITANQQAVIQSS